jgi:hypothetical protein
VALPTQGDKEGKGGQTELQEGTMYRSRRAETDGHPSRAGLVAEQQHGCNTNLAWNC